MRGISILVGMACLGMTLSRIGGRCVRACSKSPEQESQESQVDGLETGVQPVLAVLPQPPVLFQPGEAVLGNPALGHHLESVQLASLNNQHSDGKVAGQHAPLVAHA